MMANEMRDKIADIIRTAHINAHPLVQFGYAEADALIENGVIVPPCKIGDTVYVVCEDDEGNFIQENKVTEVCTNGFWVSYYVPPENDMGLFESYEDIGKTIFFTKEEAEQKLKEISYEQTDKSSG